MKHLILYFLLFPLWLNAQPGGTVKGMVLDSTNGEILPFVRVIFIDSARVVKQIAETDFDGNFTAMDLQPGYYKVVSSMTGYFNDTIKKVEVWSRSLKTVRIFMKQNVLTDRIDDPLFFEPLRDTGNIKINEEQLTQKLSKRERRRLMKVRKKATAIPKRK